MRTLLFTTFLAVASASAQQPYGYGSSGAPGQVVSVDPSFNNYGSANYSGYGGGAAPTQPSLGTVSGLAGSGSGNPMLTYGLLEGFYRYTTFQQAGIDGAHGVGVALSAELFRPFFVRGSFDWGAGNGKAVGTQGYDFNTISLGGGAYYAVNDKFHFFAEIGGMYTNLNATKTSISLSNGAVYLTPGLRFAATEFFELDVSLTATSSEDFDKRVVDIAGYYKLFSSMDVGVGTGFGNETRNFFAGVRFRW